MPTRVFRPEDVPESNASTYPEPYRSLAQRRWARRLGDFGGLANFGVNLVRIEPGGQSSCRHWHTVQDELVIIQSGRITMVTDAGEQELSPGTVVTFPANSGDGHHFLNRTDEDVTFLVVGDRLPGDGAHYPDVDLAAGKGPDGRYRYTHKDGTPY